MSDSVKKYEEMLEDGHITVKKGFFIPKSLEQRLVELESSESNNNK